MSYVIKFQAPFERLKNFSDSPDLALRRAIILQAIIDSSSTSELPCIRNHEREARAWIFGNSNYFQRICYEAGFEPSFIIKITRETIKINKKKLRTKTMIKDSKFR